MNSPIHPQFKRLAELYRDMDRSWNAVADQYGFKCEGCKDNCCFSLFFHHTHVEKDYLIHGFLRLNHTEQEEIRNKAMAYCRDTFNAGAMPESQKIPCPLLLDGRCRLYEYRPMICRMHGLPHELHKPGHPPLKGPGCDAGRFDRRPYIPFDRTPFYREMAGIEMNYRSAAGKGGKVKQAIAQMIQDPDSRN